MSGGDGRRALEGGEKLSYTRPPIADLTYQRDPSFLEQRLKRIPLGRQAGPEEIADLVVFLCGDKSTYITGAAIPIDGGFLSSEPTPPFETVSQPLGSVKVNALAGLSTRIFWMSVSVKPRLRILGTM